MPTFSPRSAAHVRSRLLVGVVAALAATGLLPVVAGAPAAAARPARKGAPSAPAAASPAASKADGGLSASAASQIAAIVADKAARTPAEQKIDSNLLYAVQAQATGSAVKGAPSMKSDVAADRSGDVLVDVQATIDTPLLKHLSALGATVVDAERDFGAIRARVPLASVEALATDPSVRSIAPAARYQTNSVGSASNEADTTLDAKGVRNTYGLDGTGVKTCVLSDGVDSLSAAQASGDLPATVSVLSGRAGTGDEGTAMLELIHDIAPGAPLGFATANGGTAAFAQSILDLQSSGCKVIVDDVSYYSERTFQDGDIAKAITTVKGLGAIYFTAATNSGNKLDGTSGTWQGDFQADGTSASPLPAGWTVHGWGTSSASNAITRGAGSDTPIDLEWADATGKSANDYDLYVLNSAGTAVVGSSTNVQNGSQDPQEEVSQGNATGDKVVVLKKSTAAARYLAIYTNRGRLAINTGGAARGHNGSVDAISVAATPAAAAFQSGDPVGPYPGTHTTANQSETFSSDGPIRQYFTPTGTAITAGNFGATGGSVHNGPDLTSADGVSTSLSEFAPFFGTSAASPNLAALAALALQAKPSETPTQLEAAMDSSTLDIEGSGVDTTTGHGIVMGPALMTTLGVTAKANLTAGTLTTAITTGNSDGVYDPGETVDLTQALQNNGALPATGISATISSPTADATVVHATTAYPDAAVGATVTPSGSPLEVKIAARCACGQVIPLSITVTYSGGFSPSITIPVSITVGKASSTTASAAYSGPAVKIPDADDRGASATVHVGNVGSISSLTFTIGGSSCTTAAGATSVGLDHTYVSDLTGTLTSPHGTTVTLFAEVGQDGSNFCQTTFSDDATTSIGAVTGSDAPFTGTYRPSDPLRAFAGQDAEGTWTFHVSDGYQDDTGSIRAFSIHIKTAGCTVLAPGDHAPVGVADTFRAVAGHALTRTAATGLLANDTDADSDALHVSPGNTNPAHGTLSVSGTGAFTYTPTAGYAGPDSFTYRPADYGLTGSATTVSFTVQTPTQAYVEQVYQDFVGRLADSAGLSFWTTRLDKGTETRTTFAKQQARSHEYATKVVVRAYQDVLGRATDPSGREYWATKVQKGMPIATLVLNLIGSNEFLTKSGGTNSGFVKATFQAILARQPSSSELSARVSAITKGTSRRQVALDLYNTSESRRHRIGVQFQLLLHRAPTSAEYSTWTAKLATQSDADLAVALAATNEYYDRSLVL